MCLLCIYCTKFYSVTSNSDKVMSFKCDHLVNFYTSVEKKSKIAMYLQLCDRSPQNLVQWCRTGLTGTSAVCRLRFCITRSWLLCENMMLFRKVDAYSILQCCQEGPGYGDRQHAATIWWSVVYSICLCRHTDILTLWLQYLASLPGAK